jgi:thioredoxin-dependent peroxiredoxin
MPQFKGVNVIGVSPDDVRSHAKFSAKNGIEFTLLADPQRKLIEPLGLWVEKSMYGKTYMGVARTSFCFGRGLRDSEGIPRCEATGPCRRGSGRSSLNLARRYTH